ncbi:MAG TPA: hypothetical protein VNO83_03240 [Pseudonocardia sp.]|nr:hypothetical protein [Pseudonocardia sp.]
MPDSLYLCRDYGLTTSTDSGVRPYRGRQPGWLNTSIFLCGGRSQTETAVGRPTTVQVRVSNPLPEPVAGVRVDAYLLPPYVGSAAADQAFITLHGGPDVVAPGSGAGDDADPHVLTCGVAGPAAPQPWVPDASQLPGGAGHLCLAAAWHTGTDGAGAARAGLLTDDDVHRGHRSQLLLTASSFRGSLLEFLVLPAPDGGPTLVELVPLHAGALDAGERWLLSSHPAVTVVGGYGRHTQRTVRGPEGWPHSIQPAQRPLGGRLVVAGARNGSTVSLPSTAEPRSAELEVGAPSPDCPGTLHALDIVQRDERGRVLGGLRVLALVTA